MKSSNLLILKILLFIVLILNSCSDYGYVDENSFLGTWELKGRSIYSQMKIRIVNKKGKLQGYVVNPPINNYGETFIEKDKTWITSISRGANYYFIITEQKIGDDLFGLYNLETNSTYYVTFSDNKEKIYLILTRPNKFTQESDIYYERIKEK